MRYHVFAAVAACLAVVGCSGPPRDTITRDPANDAGPAPIPTTEPGAGEGSPTSGTRLKQRVQKGADGSKAFVGWYDSQREEECTFMKASDNKLRCLPNVPYANLSYYSNDTCTSPVALVAKGCAAPKHVLQQVESDKCSATRAVEVRYTTNKLGDTAQVYVKGPGTCTATAQPGTSDFYGVGAVVQPTDFVEGFEERL